MPALRDAISGFYAAKFNASVNASRIAVTSGASGGLLTLAALYVNPGDEILVPDPGYPGYRHFVRAFEGLARPLAVSAPDGFQPGGLPVRQVRPRGVQDRGSVVDVEVVARHPHVPGGSRRGMTVPLTRGPAESRRRD